jgi:hypothetical protein
VPFINDFLVGADPEFALINHNHLIRLNEATLNADPYVPWGLDHNGWVAEVHPKPEFSVRNLIHNLKVSFNDFAVVAPAARWRAGAWLETPERPVTLGGHVHIDKSVCTPAYTASLDLFEHHLEALDILPAAECERRRVLHYGGFSDVRSEHGHFEYRTFPSWLFSQRIAKICLTGAKLCVVDPTAAPEMLGIVSEASVPRLKAFFERFQNRDDDVDWLLGASIFEKKLNVRVDRDLKDVWGVRPEQETPHWKYEQRQELIHRERETRDAIRHQVPVFDDDYPIRRFVFECEGIYFARVNGVTDDFAPTEAFFENLRVAIRHHEVHNQFLVAGYSGIAANLYVLGRVNQEWELVVPYRSELFIVDGQRYRVRLLSNYPELNTREKIHIHRYIRVNQVSRGISCPFNVLAVRDGLLFQVCT